MSEWGLVFLVPIRIAIILIFALCYVIGGRRWKWIRRFVGGAWIAVSTYLLAVVLNTDRWFMLFSLPAYPAALSMGYGADTFWGKVFRRALYGLLLGGCSFLFGNWALAIFQTIVAVFASVYLGIVNPVKAVEEEAQIAILCVVTVPFMV